MSDKIIIKTIEKTYFIITTFLLFIFLTFTTLFILLQNGIHIKEISISDIHIRQLYIKWDEKINLTIKELEIQNHQDADTQFDHTELYSYLTAIEHTLNLFDSIVIQNITANEFQSTLRYKRATQGFLSLSSPTLSFLSHLSYQKDTLHLKIDEFYEKEKKISANANIYIDFKNHQVVTKIDTTINNDANLSLYAVLVKNSIDFRVVSHNDIQDIKYLIKLAQLHDDIKFWTQDAIDTKSVTLESITGKINLDDLQDSIKSISVKARANGLNYSYNEKLDAIHSESTALELKEGVLYIYPKNATSYTSNLANSWLKIDFTQKEEILTLHLLFDGVLDHGIHEILKAYKIKLPFFQKSGVIATDLTLTVNLQSIDVDAQGVFQSSEANVDYLALNLDLYDTRVMLNNNLVKIESMRAKYKDIASADVEMLYHASKGEGVIDFYFDKVAFSGAELIPESSKLHATYTLLSSGDVISLEQSKWKFKEHILTLDAIKAPFDIEKLQLNIPTTYITDQNIASALIGGDIDIKSSDSNLSLDILTLNYNGLKFSQSSTPLNIAFNQGLTISSDEKIYFTFDESECVIEKPKIRIKNQEITLKNTQLNIGKYISTELFVKHFLESKKTHISLNNLLVKDPKEQSVYYQNKKILLSLQEREKGLELQSKEIEVLALFNSDSSWSIHFDSLSQIAKNSDFLDGYHFNDGELSIYKNSGTEGIGFASKFIYPYEILTENEKPTKKYNIQGEFQNETLALNINEKTDVNISKDIKIQTRNVGINVQEIMRLIKELPDNSNQNSKKIEFEATDSFIYLSEFRKAISQKIMLQYDNNILTAQLKHNKGEANLRSEEEIFYLYGKGFGDTFMHQLFSLSKFKGGVFDFSVSGNPNEYGGVAYIKDSTIMDYKILNNILAFINTVPSLVTFSLPGYSRNGLYTKEAYLKFRAKGSIFDLTDIYLESKELNILGKGVLDIEKDTIDINLNLKTDLGSNASKIPLVGHILFDKESVSTTLEITGKLSDPKVQSLIAQEIIVAPINIIKRTLSLPYNILQGIQGKEKQK